MDIQEQLAKLSPSQRAALKAKLAGAQPGSDMQTKIASLSPEQREALKQRIAQKAAADQTHATDANAVARPVAIVGTSFRLPGEATDFAGLWELLREGRDLVGAFPEGRQEALKVRSIRDFQAGYLKHVDRFDARYFQISPREAELMDPQLRLCLQTAIHVIENAGYAPSHFSGSKTGVFMAVASADYLEILEQYKVVDPLVATGNSISLLSNRLSFFLNLRGPSATIDTACSGSLVALNQAIRAIQFGECEQAIAGGVNLLIGPRLFVNFTKAGMLSPNGRCHTFDHKADGYVRGEGVIAVLLKPLDRAIADGDYIHGVIRASSVNHGGKATSLTAPNPEAQTELVASAYRAAGISPHTLSFYEAHGTGTPLGDPIEVEAILDALRQWPAPAHQTPPYIGLGSIKTNIGHLEAVSGLAGVMRVLTNMKYDRLTPTVHFEKLNPNLNLDGAPLGVVDRLQTWDRPVDAQGAELPRRAGVSSFGMGGANAHVVLEEHVNQRGVDVASSHIVVLSARDDERLRAAVASLVDYLERDRQSHGAATASLAEIAYTLQVGRDAMRARLALVTDTFDSMLSSLRAFLRGESDATLFSGEAAKSDKQIDPAPFAQRGQFAALAKLWVAGGHILWPNLYAPVKPSRVPLPGYAFAEDVFWLPEQEHDTREAGAHLPGLHPLIDSNESTLEEQTFVKTLTGQEFYLRDHIVSDHRVLPGVAYLEMAREAGRLASRSGHVARLDNIVWAQPIRVLDEAVRAHVLMTPTRDAVAFEIATFSNAGDRRVHAQGALVYQSPDEVIDEERHDLIELRNRLAATGAHLDHRAFYALYDATEVAYGTSFRVVQEVWRGEDEALSRIEIPEHLRKEFSRFAMHPVLMDGALQTNSLVLGNLDPDNEIFSLPFGLGSVKHFAPLQDRCFVYTKRTGGAGSIRKSMVLILDEDGKVLVRMDDFADRAVRTQPTSGRVPKFAGKQPRLMAVVPRFEREPKRPQPVASPDVLLLGGDQHIADALSAAGVGVHRADPLDGITTREVLRGLDPLPTRIIHVWPQQDEAQLERGFLQLFHVARGLIQHKAKDVRLLSLRIGEIGAEPHQALTAFAKTLHQENPNFTMTVLHLDRAGLGEAVETALAELEGEGEVIRYRDGVREVLRFDEITPPESAQTPLSDGGVVLISGGAGGLGRLFARHLACDGARVVLLGRSGLNRAKRAALEALDAEVRAKGGELHFRKADVTDAAELRDVVAKIAADHGPIRGVIHAAGVVHDAFLLKKTAEQAKQVLAPKIDGLRNLDAATADQPLDFFVTFSSVSAVIGNVGQIDYAYANAYMDAFAAARSRQVLRGDRKGVSLSINWPVWREGGVRMSEADARRIEETLGHQLLDSETGLDLFAKLLATDEPHVLVSRVVPEKLSEQLKLTKPAPVVEEPEAAPVVTAQAPAPSSFRLSERAVEQPRTERRKVTRKVRRKVAGGGAVDDQTLRTKTEAFLKDVVARSTKIPVHQIKADEHLENYGIDSVMILELNRDLEDRFGALSKTLFFEYQDVAGLTDYFSENHRAKLMELLNLDEGGEERFEEVEEEVWEEVPVEPATPVLAVEPEMVKSQGDIAIIGVAGRYPQAGDLFDFWTNLKNGVDAISEVPADRWDYQRHYDPQSKNTSKWGGFLTGHDLFDPLFFNISPKEAELLDPQERLFLECVWQTMENAGYPRKALSGAKVGVYVGVMYGLYQLYGAEEALKGNLITPSSSYASIANRVSYYFDFQGPSIGLDTMCSSSLTTLHLACHSLRRGEADMAIAGGVNITSHPSKYDFLSERKFTASDGRCRSFGDGGDGYVPAEGVGSLLLKPLAKAVADGDYIHGVIKASALNHGGKTNGYTVPNPNAQADVIHRALDESGLDPRTINYIEAHGTGTALGDPIEITGMLKAFREADLPKHSVAIGSVKSNIGHAESAAGVAAITKTLLQMAHGKIVPSLHSQTLNPNIDFSNIPFQVQQRLGDWETVGDAPRRAGVSSFGAGGANAHVILEEYPQPSEPAPSTDAPQLFVLSAKSAERLGAYAAVFLDWLDSLITFRRSADTQPEPIVDWRERVEGDLLTDAATVFAVAEADLDLGLSLGEYGLDVALAAKLSEAVGARYGIVEVVDVDPSDTLRGLALRLGERYGELLNRAYNHQALAKIGREFPPAALGYRLRDIAYSAQVGRETFGHRLALIATSFDDLRDKLAGFIDGGHGDVFVGDGKGDQQHAILFEGELGENFLKAIIDKGDLGKLAYVWTSGVDFDWSLVQDLADPARRVPLPHYPFDKQRYWIEPAPMEAIRPELPAATPALPAASQGVRLLEPVWTQKSAEDVSLSAEDRVLVFSNRTDVQLSPARVVRVTVGDAFAGGGEAYRLDPGDESQFAQLLQALQRDGFTATTVLWLWAVEGDQAFDHGVAAVYRFFRAIYAGGHTAPRRFVAQVGDDADRAALGGYGRSLNLLSPALSFSTVDATELRDVIRELGQSELGFGREVQIRQGRREVRDMASLTLSNTGRQMRDSGVYLISGGMGGLGRVFARYLAQTYHAKLALLGRSPLDDDKRGFLDELSQLGGEAVYHAVDVADQQAVTAVVAEVRATFGGLHGVLHAAGSVNEQTVPEKPFETFRRGLVAKVEGTRVLDLATRGAGLDFFAAFSSSSALLGDFGQADYAVGNRYQDAYLLQRERETSTDGRSITINWPLWRDGGMHLSPQAEKLYLQSSGFNYLENDLGIALFEAILASNRSQVGVLFGDLARIDRMLGLVPMVKTTVAIQAPTQSEPVATEGSLAEQVEAHIRAEVSDILKIDSARIDADENFGDFGFESVSLADLAANLSNRYGFEVSPTVFFAHSSIRALTDHLLNDHQAELSKALGAASTAAAPAVAPTPTAQTQREQLVPDPDYRPAPSFVLDAAPALASPAAPREEEPIAVIGMAGSFPQSPDLETFWTHLEAGRDLIEEIPADRWDWRAIYDDSGQDPDKTYAKWGGFVPDVDKFDARFFQLSDVEAKLMDPQHRLFLQSVWHAFEHAGYTPTHYAGRKVGLWVGLQFNDYEKLLEGVRHPHAVTGAAHSILANRVSFLFDFRGPSEPVVTACSASLVAIHRALKSLRDGESEIAVAGGVSLNLTPDNFIATTHMSMLAKDGRCKTFDESADGFVKGEGVGAFILKPLRKALADGDRVLAIVKGTAENHGGRANSLTAPNPEAQAELLVDAYRRADVDPATVGYIETHGTGTALGDPVEIEGLKKAFRELGVADKVGFCGIGSVKSNVGHLEPAAGMVGSAKVLLALQHGRLPASLHVNNLNPYVKVEGTPFEIITETRDWEPLADARGVTQPRRAGVSSFGFGGVNGHVIFEEYADTRSWANLDGEHVVVLSAKTEERLRVFAQNLADHLDRADLPDAALANLAYTSQVGRDPLRHRLAIVAGDMAELKGKVRAWLGGDADAAIVGRAAKDVSILSDASLRDKAHAWVQGASVDWGYAAGMRRVDFPRYPFAKDRHWVEPSPKLAPVEKEKSEVSRAPSFREQSEVSRVVPALTGSQVETRSLTGSDYYLDHHRIQGRRILPGVATAELARSLGASGLANVTWRKPFVLDGDRRDLTLRRDGDQLHLLAGDELLTEATLTTGDAATDERLDLSDLRAGARHVDGAETYRRAEAAGLQYGAPFQTVRNLHVHADQVLAELSLDQPRYPLDPALLDGAFQSVWPLLDDSRAYAPYSVGRILFGPDALPHACLAHVRREGSGDGRTVRCHVRIADETGRVLVAVDHLVFAAVGPRKQAPTTSDIRSFAPEWRPAAAPAGAFAGALACAGLTLTGATPVAKGAAPPADAAALIFGCTGAEDELLELVRLVKHIGPKTPILAVGAEPHVTAADGLARALVSENPAYRLHRLVWDGEPTETIVRAELNTDPVFAAYRNGVRHVRNFTSVALPETARLRDQGVYLITGATGGLGLALAAYLAETCNARVALLGRKNFDKAQKKRLKTVKRAGGDAIYVQGDVTDRDSLQNAITKVTDKFGALHGVFHAAGVLRDAMFPKKSLEDFATVVAPKIQGVRNLDALAATMDLDCLVLFSSVSAVLGNTGQTDYAAGNAFMDGFAAWRETERAAGRRYGRTVSINWPLWREGGMTLSEAQIELLFQNSGLRPLETREGFDLMTRAIASDQAQVAIFAGDVAKIDALVLGAVQAGAVQADAVQAGATQAATALAVPKPVAPKPATPKPAAPITTADPGGAVADMLTAQIAKALETDPASIDRAEVFEEYGVDSFLTLQILKTLEEDFGELPKTLLFDHPTIDELSRYFVDNHAEVVTAKFGAAVVEAPPVATPLAVEAPPVAAQPATPAPAVAQTPQGADRQTLVTALTAQIAVALESEPDKIDPDEVFEEYGVDSFLTLQIVKGLEADYGELPKTLLFDYPSINELAGYLIQNHAEVVAQKYGVVAEPAAPQPATPEPATPQPIVQPEPVSQALVEPAPAAAPQPATPAADLAAAIADDLAQRIAAALETEVDKLDRDENFEEYGVDSFLTLQILKGLEEQYGALAKTLLFDHPSINELAAYFAANHADAVAASLGVAAPVAEPAAAPAPAAEAPVQATPEPATPEPAAPQPGAPQPASGDATIVVEAELDQQPDLAALVDDLFNRHGHEAAALARHDIAPKLFIGAERRGYFTFNVRGDLLLGFSYVGEPDYIPAFTDEFAAYARTHNLKFNIFLEQRLEETGRYTATPFGVNQRLRDISTFTLEGSKMRRLRYIIKKFEKAGHAVTVEVRPGENPETDRDIAAVIDAWCDHKSMVNPYVYNVKEQILAGTLSERHRVFLTHQNGRIQNAIVITHMPSDHGYLMDLEFYPDDMPLGGLEFGIANIVAALREEGLTAYSMGASFGARISDSPNADPKVEAALQELRSRGIFDGEGNLQFKNKFRPENTPLYLIRDRQSDGGPVLDVIMMLANPDIETKTADAEPKVEKVDLAKLATKPESSTLPPAALATATAPVALSPAAQARFDQIAAAGYNPGNLGGRDVAFDLITDSWGQLDTAYIETRMAELRRRAAAETLDVDALLKQIFPFKHIVLDQSGRDAEVVFFKAFPDKGGFVPQNLLFPTWLVQQIEQGHRPLEIPTAEVFRFDSDEVFRGHLDLDKLGEALRQGGVPMVAVELADNAHGGYPVAMAHLEALHQLTRAHGVPLVLDATRLLENALAIIKHEPGYRIKRTWWVVHKMFEHADHLTASLCKNFGTAVGGVVATNDDALAEAMRQIAVPLSDKDQQVVAQSIRDLKASETAVKARMQSVRRLHDTLREAGVPVLEPCGVHAVIIDVARIPAFTALEHRLPAFLAWLYINTGIRAGVHNSGTLKNSPLNGCVRLAVPVGFPEADLDAMCDAVRAAFAQPIDALDLKLLEKGKGLFGGVHAKYDLRHGDRPVAPAPPAAAPVVDSAPQPAPAAARDLDQPVAIVGMAGVFPGSPDLDALWDNLWNGRSLVSEVPEDRWDWREFAGDPNQPNKINARNGGFIDDIDKFDSLFFGISPREARLMDPQHRLFLQTVYHAIEDAGYRPGELSGSNTGLYVGVATIDYQDLLRQSDIEPHMLTGMTHSMLPNRVSYMLNLHGPSEPIDTACSSSLVTVMRAAEAIRRGDCDLAIAGGVNAVLSPWLYIAISKAGMLSPSGACRTFDKDADGYVRGEGVGALMLKPLAKAEADGDHIYAVLRGGAVNHGGRADSLTAPNPELQGRLVAQAYQRADVDPATVTFIEAGANATPMGDPVEIEGFRRGFNKVFEARGEQPPGDAYCGVGSIKSNMGHLETAAGVAGTIKTLLAIHHGKLPPNINFNQLNPEIDLDGSPFYILDSAREWPRVRDAQDRELPRRAGVSSFGFGGVNAHLVFEEYVDQRVATADTGSHVIVLSAKREERLIEVGGRLRAYLNDADPALADLAYTLQVGRDAWAHRLAFVVDNLDDLRAKLDQFLTGDLTGLQRAQTTKTKNRVPAPEAVADLLMRRDLGGLAEAWALGADIDWTSLHGEVKPRRLALPVYPFAKVRHWVIDGPVTLAPAAATAAPAEAVAETAAPATDAPAEPVAEPVVEEPTPEAVAQPEPESVEEVREETPEPVVEPEPEPEPEPVLSPLAEELRALVADLCQVPLEDVDAHTDLADYGFDSFAGRKLINHLEGKAQLSSKDLFRHATIAELAAYIESQTHEDVEPRVDPEILDALTNALADMVQVPVDDIDVDADPAEYGFDSFAGRKLINQIEQDYGLSFTSRDLRDAFGSLRDLAQLVTNRRTETAPTEATEPETLADTYQPSAAQNSLWFINNLQPDNFAFHLPNAFRIHGGLNVDALTKALDQLLQRHRALRSTFDQVGGELRCIIKPHTAFQLPLTDLSDLEEADAIAHINSEAMAPFDFQTGPLVRFALYRLGQEDHIFGLTFHHNVFDGVSFANFLTDLRTLYRAAVQGVEADLPAIASDYAAFSQWQAEMLAGETGAAHLDYWRNQLDHGELPILNLPTDRPRPHQMTYNGRTFPLDIPKPLMTKLEALAKQQRASLFSVMMAAFQVLLYRYTQQKDVLVGTPVAGRPQSRFDHVVGYFVNMVAIRGRMQGNPVFTDFLAQLHDHVLDALDHGDYPLATLIEQLEPQHDADQNPIFQTVFILQNWIKSMDADFLHLDQGLELDPVADVHETGGYDLTLEVIDRVDKTTAYFKYNPDLFNHDRMDAFAGYYLTLLENIVADPSRKLAALDIMTPEQKEHILKGFNHFRRNDVQHATYDKLIEAQVAKYPDQQAVVFDDWDGVGERKPQVIYTYAQLNAYANRIAHLLIERGVKPDTLVGVCMDRSAEMIVAVLAVIKSGGAYVPLDPNYPQTRLQHIVDQAKPRVILTRKTLTDTLPEGEFSCIYLDEDSALIDAQSDQNPNVPIDPQNLIYVTFTSGSTGKPKGVMIEHAKLVNICYSWEEAYELKAGDRHTQMASIGFDVFSGDLTRSLGTGGTLVVVPKDFLLDPEKLHKLMVRQAITYAEFVPAVLRPLIAYCEQAGVDLGFFKVLVAGADVWTVQEYEHFRTFLSPQTRLINSYGVTESTIDSTWWECRALGEPKAKAVELQPV